MLSVGVQAKALPTNCVKAKFIQLRDNEEANILQHLEEAVTFIEEALACDPNRYN